METNCPITEDAPVACSSNWISDTMIWSSNTDPQFVQTASPLAGSLSISVQPQWVQTPVLDIVDAEEMKQVKTKKKIKNTQILFKKCIFWIQIYILDGKKKFKKSSSVMGFEHLPFWSYNLQFQMLNHYATMAKFPLKNKQWYIFKCRILLW